MNVVCSFCLFILSTIYKTCFPLQVKILLYLYINFASVPNLYFILDGFEKYKKFLKVLLTRGF